MHTKEQLREFIYWMRKEIKPAGLPGWLHFRVLCDYIRDEIRVGNVTYQDIGLRDEIALVQLELKCAKAKIADGLGTLIDEGLILALEARLHWLYQHELTRRQSETVLEFFPEVDETVAKAA